MTKKKVTPNDTRKALSDLTDSVRTFLDGMDALALAPQTDDTGKKVARLMTDLELANAKALRDGLGIVD